MCRVCGQAIAAPGDGEARGASKSKAQRMRSALDPTQAAGFARELRKQENSAAPAPAPAPAAPAAAAGPTVEWRIFTTLPVVSCIASRVFSDKGPILISAPIYFSEVLKCSPTQTVRTARVCHHAIV